jgi:UDP-glucose 4-epimerase
MSARSVLVTGARGYVGRQLVEALAREPGEVAHLVAADVRETPAAERSPGVVSLRLDVRDPGLGALLREHAVDTVVHLAAIVTPGPESSRELEYAVDVGGTRNVLEGCLAAGVRKLIVTSSGAAYGYHADNPVPLGEDAPLRGNREFAYSDHKRQVEELLAEARRSHPELAQLVLRPGAILGDRVDNQITALFGKPVVLGVAGSEGPFSFVWDQDVVACLLRGIREDVSGIYNLAGDGRTPLREIARRLGKPYLPLPAWLLRAALAVLHRLGLSRYGPEQVMFLQYRPVLSNERLKRELGYRPRLSSDEVFERWLRSRGGASEPRRPRGSR